MSMSMLLQNTTVQNLLITLAIVGGIVLLAVMFTVLFRAPPPSRYE